MTDRLTGAEVARRFRVSRRTIYRWAEAGRIPWDWREATIAPLVGVVTKKRRERSRYSWRYTHGRHRFERKMAG